MTLRNTLIDIEKLIRISCCKIVSRLPCVICILIFSIVTLLSVNNCFSQSFNVLGDNSDLYPSIASSSVIPSSSDQAILVWKTEPSLNVNQPRTVTDAYITSSIKLDSTFSWASVYGYVQNSSDSSYSLNYCIIDASNIYAPGIVGGFSNYTLQIQRILASKNLGTVIQRQNYIRLFHPSIDIQPFDFRLFLTKWILIGISIFLAIPLLWWVIKRFLR